MVNYPNTHINLQFSYNTPDYIPVNSSPASLCAVPLQMIAIVIWLQFQQYVVNMIITFYFY